MLMVIFEVVLGAVVLGSELEVSQTHAWDLYSQNKIYPCQCSDGYSLPLVNVRYQNITRYGISSFQQQCLHYNNICCSRWSSFGAI